MITRQLLLLFALCVSVHAANAVSILQCEDERGNKTFQDRCPPGTKQVNQKEYSTTAPTVTSTSKGPLTLYMIPGCDTCDQLKEFLSIRELSYTEKNVADDVALQNELKDKAGELQVPVLVVGDKVLSGYNRTALLQALTDSGHIAAGTE
jgi:glutaredoxin